MGERRELNPRMVDSQSTALIHLATSAPPLYQRSCFKIFRNILSYYIGLVYICTEREYNNQEFTNKSIRVIFFFTSKKKIVMQNANKTLLKQNAGAMPGLLREQELGYYSCNFNDSYTLRLAYTKT